MNIEEVIRLTDGIVESPLTELNVLATSIHQKADEIRDELGEVDDELEALDRGEKTGNRLILLGRRGYLKRMTHTLWLQQKAVDLLQDLQTLSTNGKIFVSLPDSQILLTVRWGNYKEVNV